MTVEKVAGVKHPRIAVIGHCFCKNIVVIENE